MRNVGIVWQTTGVARHWKTGNAGLYIELADGSNRSYNGTRNYREAEDFAVQKSEIDYVKWFDLDEACLLYTSAITSLPPASFASFPNANKKGAAGALGPAAR